ncbi:MAG: IclR family transcriptional regulator [Halofilum sp. (in: g-proteobacteria)]|nr:IclR family transcriptional regulator [Halofilum sp. (in: g-proteobacteria)]
MKPVRSVERAINILLLVAQGEQSLSLADISRETGLDKATAMRLLRTLEAYELVQRNPVTRRYVPGANAQRLHTSSRKDLRAIGRSHLRELREATHESVSLVCPRGLERVVVEVVPASHELCVVPVVGATHPVYSGASGKVIMAFLPPDERERIIDLTGLRPVTPNAVTDRATFLRELERVRAQGHAASSGDVTLGATAVAAPIFDAESELVGVVALRGPDVRMSAERLEALAPRVRGTANDISAALGGAEQARCSA